MSIKEDLVTRVATQLAAFTALVVAPGTAAKQKQELAEYLRKASAGFKLVKEHEAVRDALGVVKNLADEAKGIKRTEYESTEKFCEAIAVFQEQSAPALEALLDAVKELPDDIGSDVVDGDNTGERSTFSVTFRNKSDEEFTWRTRELAESFKNSPRLAQTLAPDGPGIADALRSHLVEDLGFVWDEPTGKKEVFYKIYRLIRPSIQKKLAELQAAL
jgi:hypothetical protein